MKNEDIIYCVIATAGLIYLVMNMINMIKEYRHESRKQFAKMIVNELNEYAAEHQNTPQTERDPSDFGAAAHPSSRLDWDKLRALLSRKGNAVVLHSEEISYCLEKLEEKYTEKEEYERALAIRDIRYQFEFYEKNRNPGK